MTESPRRRRPTIREVAQAAGVSVSTVSLVLNGKGEISSATRGNVLRIAQEFGYQANPHARMLRGSSSRIIGIALRSLDEAGVYAQPGVDHHLRLFGSAATHALDRGYNAMLVNRNVSRISPPLWVDGYLIEDPFENDPFVSHLLAARLPFVSVGPVPGAEHPSLHVSSVGGSDLVLRHLEGRGAKRVVLISARERTAWHIRGEEIYEAWMRGRGLVPRLTRVMESAGVPGGEQAMRELYRQDPTIDAVVCHTARHAAGAVAYLRSIGVDVPGEVLVAACSDGETARSSVPPITAVDLHPEELGRAAIELLMNELSEPGRCHSQTVTPELIVRGSSATNP